MKRATTRNRERKVKRVVVMLDYGDDDPDSGEIFDLTALASELGEKDTKHHHAVIRLHVTNTCDYTSERVDGRWAQKNVLCWNVMAAFESSGETGWLDDAVNASMPDSERTAELIKRVSRAERNLEKLRAAITEQRLDDAAAVRHSRPLLRVKETKPAIHAAVGA